MWNTASSQHLPRRIIPRNGRPGEVFAILGRKESLAFCFSTRRFPPHATWEVPEGRPLQHLLPKCQVLQQHVAAARASNSATANFLFFFPPNDPVLFSGDALRYDWNWCRDRAQNKKNVCFKSEKAARFIIVLLKYKPSWCH